MKTRLKYVDTSDHRRIRVVWVKMSQERFAGCSLRDFVLEEELSRGTQGSVWKVKFKYDGKQYVLKELKLTGKLSQRNAFKEVELLRQLDHRNCVRCFGHFVDNVNNMFCIILDYCGGGDLAHLIEQHKRKSVYLEESYIWSIFHQICLGVQHLHQLGIVHRDLKTSNIFLTDNKTPKIGDLGVSYQVRENVMLQSFSGTPLYLSPELVRGDPYNEKTDIWSLGIVMYELCSLSPPFTGSTLLNLAQAIDTADIPPLPNNYSSKIERFIKWLLQRDYTHRPSIAQVVEKVRKQLLTIQEIVSPPTCENHDSQPVVLSSASTPIAPIIHEEPPRCQVLEEHTIILDLHRLTILEKRDKLTLRKLLQTRTLSNHQNLKDYGGLNDQIRDVECRIHLLEDAISSGGRIERADAERLGLLSDRSEVLKAQSKHPRRELTENLVGSHHLDKSNPSTSVKIQTFLHADDRPADNIFQSEKQRQSVFTSPRKASAVACTAESDRGKMLPSATSSQPAVMEQRARAPRFNVITGRDF